MTWRLGLGLGGGEARCGLRHQGARIRKALRREPNGAKRPRSVRYGVNISLSTPTASRNPFVRFVLGGGQMPGPWEGPVYGAMRYESAGERAYDSAAFSKTGRRSSL